MFLVRNVKLFYRFSLPLLTASLILTLGVSTSWAAPCGDINDSGQINVADAVYLINYIFASGPAPLDDSAGDFNCSGQTDIADAVMMISFIFASGPAPCSAPGCAVGVLLAGDPASPAVAATVDYGPFAADSAEIDSTGLFLTRISATIHPEATVGEINAALTSIGGRISFMNPQDLDITVAIAPVANRAEADSLAAILVQSGAFLFAFPEYQPSLNGASGSAELPPNGTAFIDHLLKLRMPAAWNAKGRAEQVNQVVTVFVPDGYRSQTPHPEVPSQTFVTGEGNPFRSSSEGNHGFSVCGIIGSKHDAVNTTGIHPLDQLLSIRSMLTGGLTFNEIYDQIAKQLPAGRFVLNTSLGYPRGGFEEVSKMQRVVLGMKWRSLVLQRKDDFIHVATAGNTGNDGENSDESRNAYLGAPWNVAAAFASPIDAFAPGELGFFESLALQDYWDKLVGGNPFMEVKLNNVLVVGSSDFAGNPSAFSSLDTSSTAGLESVRALGEGVVAPCIRPGGGCVSVNGFLQEEATGTSIAAPQIAGLAAYMLNLDPTLSNNEIKGIIRTAYEYSQNQGFVDAYAAVLAVDPTLADANVRFALLDVADAAQNEIPDNVFDEHDIQFFLTKFAEYEQIRAGIPDAPADYSRFDLNGDGFTGGTNYVAKFDLDINYPPQYTTVTAPFGVNEPLDENTLVDLDILCYYANTPLYTGNDSIKTELLVDCPCAQVESRDAQCGGCDVPMNELWTNTLRNGIAKVKTNFGCGDVLCNNTSNNTLMNSSSPNWIDSLVVENTCNGAVTSVSTTVDMREEFNAQQSKWTLTAVSTFRIAVKGPSPNGDCGGQTAGANQGSDMVFQQLDDTCDLQYTARFRSAVVVPPQFDPRYDYLALEAVVFDHELGHGEHFSSVNYDSTITGDLVDAFADGGESNIRIAYFVNAGKGPSTPDDSALVTCTLTVVVEPKPTAAKARIRNAGVAPLPESPLLQTPSPAAVTDDRARSRSNPLQPDSRPIRR